MRVLVVSQYFWPEAFRINDLAVELARRGHDVTVLTGQPTYPTKDTFKGQRRWWSWSARLGDVQILRVPLVARGRGQSWRLALNYLSFAASASVLAPLRARGPYDVMLVFQMSPVTMAVPAVVLKRLRGIPLTMWVQDLWPETLAASGAVKSPQALGVLERLVRWIYRHCDHVFTQSPAFFAHVRRAGLPPARMSYLPNWAEATYRPVEVALDASERALVPSGFTVMLAGNLGTVQALDTVLDAAEVLRDHPEITWLLVGDGQLRPWVQEQVRRRGLEGRVRLLGRHPVEAMPRFFALADVLLVTLKRDAVFALTVPSRLQSYLACGRPVVGALDGVGARVIEESGAGLAVAAQDSAGLARAVLEMYAAGPERRRAMGTNGHSYFLRHFERTLLLDQLEARLVQVAGSGAAAGRLPSAAPPR